MRFSVIVPTYNRLESLKKTIESILKQEYPDFETIIVNDGSIDGTDAYLSQLAAEKKIKYIKQSNGGPANARNAGIKNASGDTAAFTDDDCVLAPDWLRKLSAGFERTGARVVGGIVTNRATHDFYADLSQEMTTHFVRTLAQLHRPTAFLTSNNIAYDMQTLRRAGGFDERFRHTGGEERALNSRIIDEGGISLLLDDLNVDHYHQFTAGSFFRQQRNYGRGSYLLYRVAGKELGRPPEKIPIQVHFSMVTSFFRSGAIPGIRKTLFYVAAQFMVILGFMLQAAAPRRARRGPGS